MRLLPGLAVLCLFVAGCQCNNGEAIRVKVKFETGALSRCTQVVVLGPPEVASNVIDRGVRTELTVGILRTDLPKDIRIVARGFASSDCTKLGAVLEKSAELAVSFIPAPQAQQVELTIKRGMLVLGDADSDGFAALDAGGTDCRDDDPAIHPGASEDCLSAVDSNCSGTVGCKDPFCDTKLCEAGGHCAGLACADAGMETDCTDGVDNDGNGKTDCKDSQCLNALCASTDKCSTGARCDVAGDCDGGTARKCESPPGACFADAGICLPADGTCQYLPTPGVSCVNGDKCKAATTCDAVGACNGGSAVMCAANTNCQTNSCNPATGCVALNLDAGCSTGDLCLIAEVCSGGTCGGGAPVSCLAPPECRQLPGSCIASDGGCGYALADAGATCDGGTCTASGFCLPSFEYPVSNFDASYPVVNRAVVIDCVAQFDSTPDAGNHFPVWCAGAVKPVVAYLPGGGGGPVAFMSVLGLTVTDAGTLSLVGSSPVLFAVHGDAIIEGRIEASADHFDGGPGSFSCMGTSPVGQGGNGVAYYASGGGGGAAFGAAGGIGGPGRDETPPYIRLGGTAGLTNGGQALSPLRGGCMGGNGGTCGYILGTLGPTPGGGGGGGLQISATGRLIVSGHLAASGGGGLPGIGDWCGGGGGGSGGGILLEAADMILSGSITANGGAGGGGRGERFGTTTPGIEGENGSPDTASVASGGAGGASPAALYAGRGGRGGNGGAGSTQAANGDAGSPNDYGGGGGGGAVGRIRYNAWTSCSIVGSVISPDPTKAATTTCP